MTIEVGLINGIALGIEYAAEYPEEDVPAAIIIDVLVFRFVIQW